MACPTARLTVVLQSSGNGFLGRSGMVVQEPQRSRQQPLAALRSGEAKILTKDALRIPAADLTLARKQAEQKGLP